MEQEKPAFFKDLVDLVQRYVHDRLLLLKLQAAEKSAKVVSLVLVFFFIALMTFFVFLFLGMLAGYYFASLTGSLVSGFAIVTGIFLLIAILLIVLRKRVIGKFIANTVIRIFFDATAEDAQKDGKEN